MIKMYTPIFREEPINFIKADLDTVCTAALLTSYPKTYQENTRY